MKNDLPHVAKAAFDAPFFADNTLRAELRAEAPLKLAYAMLPSGLTYGQLNALALAVRTVGELEDEGADKAITKKQKAAWDKLVAEKALPKPFRGVLEAAEPQLSKRRDLYALYGVLAGTMQKLVTLGNVGELAVKEPPKAIKAPRRTRTVKG